MSPLHAHEVVLELERDADAAAPGAAVTVALCGHWEHAGPCRWPHRTDVASVVARVASLRIVFSASSPEVAEVRARIVAALEQGGLEGPDGRVSRWKVLREAASEPRAGESLS